MTDEKFFAWLDGQLDATEAAEVEARLAADPELARLADEHREFGHYLRAAFDPLAEAAVPARLQRAVRPTGELVDLASRQESRLPRRSPLPQWAAMAATLVVGIVFGTMVGRVDAPVEVRQGKIYAAASLDDALEHRLASAPQGEVRIGLTFRDRAGDICRSFVGAGASGLACREGDAWRLRGLFESPEGQSGDYRMATGADPHLGGLIDETIAGEPLDAMAEEQARGRGWR